MKHLFFSFNPDLLGFTASILCAVHCAALPFLVSIAPLAGLHFLANPGTELLFIGLSLLLASFTLLKGYYRHHRRKTAPVIVITGFLLIVSGQLAEAEWQEIIFSTSGAIFIAIAHLVNRKHIQLARPAKSQRVSS